MELKPVMLYICSLFLAVQTFAFRPHIINYARDNYGAASQNWALGQDSRGVVYIGNNNGLLEFNGKQWQLHKLGERENSVRAMFIDSNDRIYVGALEEIGYFERNRFGELEYRSLSQNGIGAQLRNKHIWSIVKQGEKIWFQTFEGYFVYDGETTEAIPFNQQSFILHNATDAIYTFKDDSLMLFDDGKLSALAKMSHIVAVIPSRGHSVMAVSEKDGIWCYDAGKLTKWSNDVEQEIIAAKPNRATLTRDSLVVVGTVLNGLYVLDLSGKLRWHLNTAAGLQNNTVLAVMCDRQNNIWAALDNGIALVVNNEQVMVARWQDKNIGFIYDVQLLGDKFFFATNQGLFTIGERDMVNDMNKDRIALVPDTQGFIYDLHKTSDNKLIVGHNQKTMLIESGHAPTVLFEGGGSTCIRELTLEGRNYCLQSNYRTFDLFEQSAATGKWRLKNHLRGFNDRIQYFEADLNGTIWASHINRGLYRLKLNKSLDRVVSSTYYPSPDSISVCKTGVFKVAHRIVFTDGVRCYTYDDLTDRITPYGLINDNLGHFASAHRIVPVDLHRYWFITQSRAALVSFEQQLPDIITTISYRDYGFSMLNNYENIVPITADYSILCGQNSIARLSHSRQSSNKELLPRLFVASAIAYNSRQNNTCPMKLDQTTAIPTLPYKFNSVRFRVASPVYGRQVAMRYKLHGMDNNWRSVSANGRIEYARLPYGSYRLEITSGQGQNIDEVSSVVYAFHIRPPLYASWFALLFYFILLAALVLLVNLLAKRRAANLFHERHERQSRAIIELENEKLTNEISFKSKELASSTMNLIQQTEMLLALKEELDRQKEQLGVHYPNKYYNRMLSIIENNLSSEHDWEIFQTNFDRIHEGFFRKLRQRYAELSSQDLKLCALIRLNLDTKEIAGMMNITIRGVETRRYRLRKRLELGTKDSLTGFLIDFK